MVHRKALGEADFLELLCKAADEYGFCHEGVLRIPYEAKEFEEWMMMIKRPKTKNRLIETSLDYLTSFTAKWLKSPHVEPVVTFQPTDQNFHLQPQNGSSLHMLSPIFHLQPQNGSSLHMLSPKRRFGWKITSELKKYLLLDFPTYTAWSSSLLILSSSSDEDSFVAAMAAREEEEKESCFVNDGHLFMADFSLVNLPTLAIKIN
ncbi:hypothetical protein JRO89_XS09G0243100 [Xanthoceras sorbifolium]|uniref:Uncharacterized protein n=1 Tax=Xanthoceras sorbifolium TaxID=99658 RepID=A0ABQ8HMV0_9ROSI|nr:hypothetical protein JRO89_XS09G0243100 [Xanthoceras sorbifolium]